MLQCERRISERRFSGTAGEFIYGLPIFISGASMKKENNPSVKIKSNKKHYIPIDEQIAKLKRDGLQIPDEKRARLRLKWEGYFNFAVGYNRLFKDDKKRYFNGVTFEHIEALYDFDKHLRAIAYEYAQSVECTIKALVSDLFSRRYGVDEKTYLSAENFSAAPADAPNVNWVISTCKRTLEEAVRKDTNSYRDYIAYTHSTYKHVPFWALIRALSFGNVSKFLKVMKREDRAEIAREYGLSGNTLCNMLEIAVCFRNIAAHGERMYCASLSATRLTDKLSVFYKLQIPRSSDGSYRYGRRDFMSFLITLKYLLPTAEFSRCMQRVVEEVETLERSIPSFAMQRVYAQSGLLGSWKKLDKIRK